jgi:hypothetical protein
MKLNQLSASAQEKLKTLGFDLGHDVNEAQDFSYYDICTCCSGMVHKEYVRVYGKPIDRALNHISGYAFTEDELNLFLELWASITELEKSRVLETAIGRFEGSEGWASKSRVIIDKNIKFIDTLINKKDMPAPSNIASYYATLKKVKESIGYLLSEKAHARCTSYACGQNSYFRSNDSIHETSYGSETGSGWGGYTPLTFAADFDDVDLIHELCKLGADPDKKDAKGLSALERAADYGFHRSVQALLQYKQSNANIEASKRRSTRYQNSCIWGSSLWKKSQKLLGHTIDYKDTTAMLESVSDSNRHAKTL